MAYPETSNWQGATAHDAWFLNRATSQVCRTDGRSFLYSLYARARERLEETGPIPWAGGTVSLAQLSDDSSWTPALLQAVDALARRDRAPADFLTAMDAAATTGVVTPMAMQTIVWVEGLNAAFTAGGQRVYGQGSPADVEFGGQVSFPYVGLTPPDLPFGQQAETGVQCLSLADLGGVMPPVLRDPGSLPFSPLLAFGLVTAALIAAALITSNTPVRKLDR